MEKNQALEQEIARRKAITEQRDRLSNRLDMISRHEVKQWGIDTIVGNRNWHIKYARLLFLWRKTHLFYNTHYLHW